MPYQAHSKKLVSLALIVAMLATAPVSILLPAGSQTEPVLAQEARALLTSPEENLTETWNLTFYVHLPALYMAANCIETHYIDEDYEPPGGGGYIDFEEIEGPGGLGQLWFVPLPEPPLNLQITRSGETLSASFEFIHQPTGYTVTADLSGTIVGDAVSFNINYHLPAEVQNYEMPLSYSDEMSEWEGTVYYSLPAELTEVFEGNVIEKTTGEKTIEGTFTANVDGQFARWRFHEKEYEVRLTPLGPVREKLLFDGIVELTFSDLSLHGDFEVGWDATTITGYVEDGYGHRLGGIELTLLIPSPGGLTTAAVTITDDEGKYLFGAPPDTIGPGTYQIEIALERHKTVGDTAIFSINHDVGPSVHAQTDTFDVPVGEFVKDISLADPSLTPANGIPGDRLDDLAAMYYHVKQAVDFERTELGVTPDLLLPIEVHAYKQGTEEVFYSGGDITIGDAVSGYNDQDRPMNREWHEMFHELMDDTVGMPPRHAGDTNHGGYANHCTGDSWVEGWAEYWSCALKGYLGSASWRTYDWAGGNTNLDLNWTVWDDEEFAVAGLLVDLVDPVEVADGDFISLTNPQLWAIIGSAQLADMNGVYAALVASNVGQLDTDTDGTSDLDELFIRHGFFADDGNKQYDAGEVVGLGGQPGRTDKPAIPGSSIRIIVTDPLGNPISTGTLLVDIVFPSPMDIYNYSYEVTLSGSDSQVGFYVAPNGVEAQMTMRVRGASGTLSDQFTLSNSVYWEKVKETTTGYAVEDTFVLAGEGVASISSLDNQEALPGETVTVVISGTYFTGATSVSFGSGITVNSFAVNSATQITASISVDSAAALGARDVSVTTPAGTGTKTGGFTVNQVPSAPTITSVSPSHGTQGQSLSITITGTNLTGATGMTFGPGITINSFTVNSSTQITANITVSGTATSGSRDVSVTTPGGVATITSGFSVAAVSPSPTIASVNPSHGNQGQTENVTITGTNLNGATAVSFGSGISVNGFTVESSSQITTDITISGTAAVGSRDVSVTTPAGTGTKTGGFTVKERAGEAGGCSCSKAKASTSTSQLLIGWGVLGLCLATCYSLAKRIGKKGRK